MIVTGIAMDFNLMEGEIYRKCCELGRTIIAAVLKEWDEELRESRDKGKYRHKGCRKTSVKTIVGVVEYERALYEIWEDGVKTGSTYLLGEALGDVASRRMSGMLSALIVKSSCEGAYRHAARAVSEMTGQQISHTTAWKTVQTVGTRLLEEDAAAARLASKGEGTGSLETKILFDPYGITKRFDRGSKCSTKNLRGHLITRVSEILFDSKNLAEHRYCFSLIVTLYSGGKMCYTSVAKLQR